MTERAKRAKQNLTLAIDRETLREARKYALDRGTTVNELVRELLTELAGRKAARLEAAERIKRAMREGLGEPTDWKFKRDEIYEERLGRLR